MSIKTRSIIIIFFAIALTGLILIFLLKKESPAILNKNKIEIQSLIEYPAIFNYRQTINDCGPYNTFAVIRALKGEDSDPQAYVKSMKWRLPNKYTIPWGLEKQLEENGIVIETPNLEQLTNEDKIVFLKEQLTLKKPIIILGERENYEHYITLFGFNSEKDEFYAYDSLYKKHISIEGITEDDNGNLPGNRNLTSNELLNFWEKGGMYGLFKWYAIVASIKGA